MYIINVNFLPNSFKIEVVWIKHRYLSIISTYSILFNMLTVLK